MPRAGLRSTAVVAIAVTLGLIAMALAAPLIAGAAAPPSPPSPEAPAVADIPCDPGAHPEHMQGRVSSEDVKDGYAASGYRCNTTFVSQYSNVGGFRVQRYVDQSGRACAFYDSTLLFTTNAVMGSTHKTGVFVMDMPRALSDLLKPVRPGVSSARECPSSPGVSRTLADISRTGT
jgi:hypothetical protein